MSGKIEISREQLETVAHRLSDIGQSHLSEPLFALLAAPVVERQDPVYQVRSHGSCCWEDISGESLYVCAAQPEEYEIRKLYTSPPAPVAADIAHDRAYRNGMMAGFQFGISGNEKGYAVAIANFNSEIRAAKGEQPASVAIVLPTILSSEQGPHYSDNRTSELGYLAGYNACLDKFKELNQ